ncbi:hypothetical protein [Providencia sp. PROV274]|uniref:hypothetical protein n=1 Tax=Providencia sp. PROV274 TaxID=2949961 RepID=UPI00234BEFD0|nr:hypothetical protein [Providencia sp. PROV274]
MSSLNKYRNKPSTIVSTAISLSKGQNRKKTITVEGNTDKVFFEQWFGGNNKVRFAVAGDKDNVIETYQKYCRSNVPDKNFLFFCVDLDYDLIHGKENIIKNEHFLCNVYCLNKGEYFFNDMESFLVNTSALRKILSQYNFDINENTINDLLNKIELASRTIGKYRAADDIVKNKLNLSKSILNGLHVEDYFDSYNFCIDEDKLRESLPNWSNYKYYIDDLIECANEIDTVNSTKWYLSKGHDITEMLSLYLEARVPNLKITSKKIEELLRVGCERSDIEKTPMYEKLKAENVI